jgi:hypothetical protein
MAEKELNTKIEEEKTNGGRKTSKRTGGVTKRGKSGTGTTGESGAKTGDSGKSGGEGREATSGDQGNQGSSTGDKERRKNEILQRLTAKRNERNNGISDDANSTTEDDVSGNGFRSEGLINGDESDDRTGTGQAGKITGTRGKSSGDDGDSDGDSTSISSDSGREARIKGVKFEIPKFTPPVNEEKPVITNEKQLESELTVKESKELQPRIENALRMLFNGTDKVISVTTKRALEEKVFIWSSVDDDEITMIATYMLEAGQKSRVVSTITRRMSRDYMLLNLSIIALPRFIETYKHYALNGFGLTLGK